MEGAKPQLDPSSILQTAFGFWASKVLLTAVEFGVFTKLSDRRITGPELGAELGLHPRGISDFFDALVAMQFLDREGDGPSAKYFNTPAGALYLIEGSPRYVGGWLVMLNNRLFKFWHDLPLPRGGALVAIEALIDDARRQNVFGLLMSLNMLIEFGDAFDYSGADFRGWCSEIGFQRFEVMHLEGASSAAIAYK